MGPSLDVGTNHEISADERALALGYLKFFVAVGNPIPQRLIVCQEFSAVVFQVEVEHVTARKKYPGPAHEQVTEEDESCSNKMERVFMRSPLFANLVGQLVFHLS